MARLYAIAVPPAFQALITHPDDPIGRQVIPHPNELLTAANEHEDPTADAAMSPVEGVVRRYPDRALLKPVLACPLYCRFCFRRAHVGPEGSLLSETALDAALNWIAGEAALREVILTGGDPLILSPRRLAHIMGRLSAMPHIDTIRIHTRVPVAAPERIDDALIASLTTDTPLRVILHANAAAELTEAARAAIRHLLTAAIPVLSQSVLLRGVNDTPERLESLLRALLKARVTPATLHQLDRAPGTPASTSRSKKVARCSPACAAASPATQSPLTCSISKVVTAKSRSARTTSPPTPRPSATPGETAIRLRPGTR